MIALTFPKLAIFLAGRRKAANPQLRLWQVSR